MTTQRHDTVSILEPEIEDRSTLLQIVRGFANHQYNVVADLRDTLANPNSDPSLVIDMAIHGAASISRVVLGGIKIARSLVMPPMVNTFLSHYMSNYIHPRKDAFIWASERANAIINDAEKLAETCQTTVRDLVPATMTGKTNRPGAAARIYLVKILNRRLEEMVVFWAAYNIRLERKVIMSKTTSFIWRVFTFPFRVVRAIITLPFRVFGAVMGAIEKRRDRMAEMEPREVPLNYDWRTIEIDNPLGILDAMWREADALDGDQLLNRIKNGSIGDALEKHYGPEARAAYDRKMEAIKDRIAMVEHIGKAQDVLSPNFCAVPENIAGMLHTPSSVADMERWRSDMDYANYEWACGLVEPTEGMMASVWMPLEDAPENFKTYRYAFDANRPASSLFKDILNYWFLNTNFIAMANQDQTVDAAQQQILNKEMRRMAKNIKAFDEYMVKLDIVLEGGKPYRDGELEAMGKAQLIYPSADSDQDEEILRKLRGADQRENESGYGRTGTSKAEFKYRKKVKINGFTHTDAEAFGADWDDVILSL